MRRGIAVRGRAIQNAPTNFEVAGASSRQGRARRTPLELRRRQGGKRRARARTNPRPISSNGTSIDHLECERDALAAADAHSDDPAPEAVATHRMYEAGCQHRAGGADRMPVGDRAAFDIDDVGRKPELARDGNDDRGEGLVDLDALDIAEPPPRPVE